MQNRDYSKIPVIGITPGFDSSECMVTQRPDYFTAIEQTGALPLLLPLTDEPRLVEAMVNMVDGVVFSGGPDVDPMMFGEFPSPLLGEVVPARDHSESALFKEIFKTQKPVLGICRGMQFVNVMLGGTLYQNLETSMPGLENQLHHVQTENRVYPTHSVAIKKGSLLEQCYGKEGKVNSFHHQGVKELGKGLRVTAVSSDGLIEGAEYDGERFLQLVQWHPESMVSQSEGARKLFSAFVSACME